MARLETVRIVRDGDVVTINKADQKDGDELYVAPEPEPEEKPAEDELFAEEDGRVTHVPTGNYAQKVGGGWFAFFGADGNALEAAKVREDDVREALEALA